MGRSWYAEKLIEFYSKHDPARVSQVEAQLAEHKGPKEELMKKVHIKYGVPYLMECAAPPSEMRCTVYDFYLVHNRDRLVNVETIVEHSKGREDELITKIYNVYNVERTTAAKQLSYFSWRPFYHEKLCEFYRQHNPSKLESIDLILDKYEGDEYANLFEDLYQTYNVPFPCNPANRAHSLHQPVASLEQMGRSWYAEKLIEFYSKHDPARVSQVEAQLAEHKGPKEELMKKVHIKYGVPYLMECAAPPSEMRCTVYDFYLVHNRDKLVNVETIVEHSKGREDELIRQLHDRYDVERTTAAKQIKSYFSWRPFYHEKLCEFYRQHNPSKLESIDLILDKYEGDEYANLFEDLYQTYNVPFPCNPANRAHRKKLISYFKAHDMDPSGVDVFLLRYEGLEEAVMGTLDEAHRSCSLCRNATAESDILDKKLHRKQSKSNRVKKSCAVQ